MFEPGATVTAGLYGNAVPATVANFKSAVMAGVYTETTFHRILPGEYIQAGLLFSFMMVFCYIRNGCA